MPGQERYVLGHAGMAKQPGNIDDPIPSGLARILGHRKARRPNLKVLTGDEGTGELYMSDSVIQLHINDPLRKAMGDTCVCNVALNLGT